MSDRISSSHNPRFKDAVRLRERRGRFRQGRTIIDGAREIRRAMDCGVEMIELYVEEQRSLEGDAAAVWERAMENGIDVVMVPTRLIRKMAYGDRNDGIVAVAVTPERKLEDLHVPENALVAVIECVQKPGNLGAILRSADAAGLSAVIVANAETDLFNPNAIRASMGAIFALLLAETSTDEAIVWLHERSFQILAARVDASLLYSEMDYTGATAMVFGNESRGLSRSWQGSDVAAVSLPMSGVVDSLNVSVTAAVLFYEAMRQRGGASSWTGDS